MALKLHNTLTNKTEEFRPVEVGKVRMYHCGPTVYDYVHIGNLRSFLLADILRRTFEYLGFEVKQVMNITDVGIGGNNDEGEDKIIKGLKREGKPVTMEAMKELGDFYTEKFKEDVAKLNIKMPHILPKASEHIPEQIELIKVLEEKGFTYKTSDGIYFDTSKDPHYGKLGGLGKEMESRIENSEKRNARDFALWKFNSNLGFPSPWGQGFPGWHIECSAMSSKYLGKTFDIHTGGIDLTSIHHNNEIAQSENACLPVGASAKSGGCEFAHYWLHNEFVNVGPSTALGVNKMAKSEGNQINLKDIPNALAYRYFLLQASYRTPVTFSPEALTAAQNAYRKLKDLSSRIQDSGIINEEYKKKFKEALEDDLNTPEALSVVWNLIKDEKISDADKRTTLLDFDQVLGLDLAHNEFLKVPEEIVELGRERDAAKLDKNYALADKIRVEIESKGFEIRDVENTFIILRK